MKDSGSVKSPWNKDDIHTKTHFEHTCVWPCSGLNIETPLVGDHELEEGFGVVIGLIGNGDLSHMEVSGDSGHLRGEGGGGQRGDSHLLMCAVCDRGGVRGEDFHLVHWHILPCAADDAAQEASVDPIRGHLVVQPGGTLEGGDLEARGRAK